MVATNFELAVVVPPPGLSPTLNPQTVLPPVQQRAFSATDPAFIAGEMQIKARETLKPPRLKRKPTQPLRASVGNNGVSTVWLNEAQSVRFWPHISCLQRAGVHLSNTTRQRKWRRAWETQS